MQCPMTSCAEAFFPLRLRGLLLILVTHLTYPKTQSLLRHDVGLQLPLGYPIKRPPLRLCMRKENA